METEINKVLAQMRSLQAEMKPAAPLDRSEGADFGAALRSAVETVSTQQNAASRMATEFQTGETDASVAEVMVAMQKASLSFQAMTEVRNKLVEAYKEVMNMPI